MWKKDRFSGLFWTGVILSIDKIILSKENGKNKKNGILFGEVLL